MSSDTFTALLGVLQQGTGNNNNSWGVDNNTALALLDNAIAGRYVNAALTGGNLAMDGVVPPAGPHPLPQMVVSLAGTLTSNQTVTVPNVPKIWYVANGCTGAFTLAFKTTSGSAGAAIPQGGSAWVHCDGANNIFVGLSTALRDVQWLGFDGTLANPGISFKNEPGSGLSRKSTGVLALGILGAEIADISATGINLLAGGLTVGGVALVPPGTEVNFAGITPPTGWYLEFGQTIARAGDAALLAALTKGFTATTNGTTTLSSVSIDLTGLGLEGSSLEGVGMATGATIVSLTSTAIIMSIAATNSAAGGAVTAYPYGNGDGSTTFKLPDARGTVAAGRTNMGGTALTNLTTAGSGVNGLQLNTVGGNQNITITLGMVPAGITSAGTLTGTASGSIAGSLSQTPVVEGSGSGIGGGGSFGVAGSSSVTGTFSGTASVSGTLTSNNTGGSTTPLVQPTRIRNVMIKR